MKSLRLFILPICLIVFLACSNNDNEKTATNIKNEKDPEQNGSFKVQDEFFSLTFPQKPKIEIKEIETEFGLQKVTMYDLEISDSRLQFIFSDYPQLVIELGGTEDIFKSVLDVISSQTDSEYVSDSIVTIGNLQANVYQFQSDLHNLKIIAFFDENRLYQLIYRTLKTNQCQFCEDFVSSFSLK
jgi:hypothetical protein